MTSRTPALLALALALSSLAGCAGNARLTGLTTLGVHVLQADSGWYRLRSDDGYSFELPGMPLAERQEYVVRGHRVRATFYDLPAEDDSRAFLARAFDCSAMSDADRERVRELAEAQITDVGEIESRRTLVHAGTSMHEAVVDGVSRNEHRALVRTFVTGGFVFQLVTIAHPEAGAPSDAERFFGSVRIEAPTAPAPRASANGN